VVWVVNDADSLPDGLEVLDQFPRSLGGSQFGIPGH
jgi:hypothetical protein